jgi:hypothetical protein
MTLDEYTKIYRDGGTIATRLVISEVECNLEELLTVTPELSVYFESSGHSWCRVLKQSPEYHIYCDWSKLSELNWAILLTRRPEFGIHCNWSKIKDWLPHILEAQPELIHQGILSNLSDSGWDYLLETRPQLAIYRQ